MMKLKRMLILLLFFISCSSVQAISLERFEELSKLENKGSRQARQILQAYFEGVSEVISHYLIWNDTLRFQLRNSDGEIGDLQAICFPTINVVTTEVLRSATNDAVKTSYSHEKMGIPVDRRISAVAMALIELTEMFPCKS